MWKACYTSRPMERTGILRYDRLKLSLRIGRGIMDGTITNAVTRWQSACVHSEWNPSSVNHAQWAGNSAPEFFLRTGVSYCTVSASTSTPV